MRELKTRQEVINKLLEALGREDLEECSWEELVSIYEAVRRWGGKDNRMNGKDPILKLKEKYHRTLANLSFEEKLKIIQQMRETFTVIEK